MPVVSDKGTRLLAIVGCTASGKTALSIELAKRLNGEIISCDSMQIYRGMNIGTAKPDKEERQGIEHHLIDICDPADEYSCADYVKAARSAIEDITRRGRLPIICGGTGLYLDRLLRGGNEECADSDPRLRAELEGFCRENGVEALHEMLRVLDPESADAIHKNNVKRVIRAIEICRVTGEKKSVIDKRNCELDSSLDPLVLYLHYRDREVLYDRIERRVDEMIKAGLVEEARRLYSDGVFERSRTASAAIGYKEILPYIRGQRSLEECVLELKTATRKYAKRQMTWFSSKEYATRVEMCGEKCLISFEDIVNFSQTLFYNY